MSFEGRWDITIATPIGKQEVILQFAERDGDVTGFATQGNETVPLIDPRREGERLRWSQHVTKPMKLSVAFDVRREGDALSGTARPGILPSVKVSGQRSRARS